MTRLPAPSFISSVLLFVHNEWNQPTHYKCGLPSINRYRNIYTDSPYHSFLHIRLLSKGITSRAKRSSPSPGDSNNIQPQHFFHVIYTHSISELLSNPLLEYPLPHQINKQNIQPSNINLSIYVQTPPPPNTNQLHRNPPLNLPPLHPLRRLNNHKYVLIYRSLIPTPHLPDPSIHPLQPHRPLPLHHHRPNPHGPRQ